MTQASLTEPLIRIEAEEFIAWSSVKYVNFATNRIYFLGSGDRGIVFTDEVTREMLEGLGWPVVNKVGMIVNPAAISHISPAKGNTNVVRIDFKDGGQIVDQSLQINAEMYADIIRKWEAHLNKK